MRRRNSTAEQRSWVSLPTEMLADRTATLRDIRASSRALAAIARRSPGSARADTCVAHWPHQHRDRLR
jgi:hypothetical protein